MAPKVSAKSPLQTRREEEKEERRQAILDATEQVIAKVGWDNTHYGEIAKASRLSRSLVYFYFPTREELFHAVCGRGLAELQRRFARALAKHPLGIDQLMAIGRAYHAFSQDEPLYFSLMTHLQAQEYRAVTEPGPEKDAHEQGRGCLGLVVQALVNGLKDGSIRPSVGDPRPSAVAIWAFTHGLIQISSQKAAMLKEEFQLTSKQTLDHGFTLMRSSLSTGA